MTGKGQEEIEDEERGCKSGFVVLSSGSFRNPPSVPLLAVLGLGPVFAPSPVFPLRYTDTLSPSIFPVNVRDTSGSPGFVPPFR